jgi:polar amino acid transport system substrate-binding protein
MGALATFELDLVAGGLSDESPWSSDVGLTRYFYEEEFDVGIPPGAHALNDLDGQQIAVADLRLSGLLREQGAEPIHVSGGEASEGRPFAAAKWELAKYGLIPTDHKLHGDRHVIAVAPGENHLVMRLEEFLASRFEDIPIRLAQQQEVPE